MHNCSEELRLLVFDISKNQSEASYKKLFCLLYNPLFRFSLPMVKSRELADEVASDVLIKLWQKREDLMYIENIQVYALVIARNLSLNAIKKNTRSLIIPLNDRSTEINHDILTPEEILINSQDKNKIEKSVEGLPTRCKLVFKLIKEEGLSYKEVAEVLNISVKTVDAHLVTAMKKLTSALNVNADR